MTRTLVAPALTLCLLLAASPASARPYPLTSVLGERESTLLAQQGISDTAQLLVRAATPAKRRALAKATGLGHEKLLSWARMGDLFRIRGVGPQMVKLLAAAQIYTVKEFRTKTPRTLAVTLKKVNKKEKITQTPPTRNQLRHWIDQAKKLKLVLK